MTLSSTLSFPSMKSVCNWTLIVGPSAAALAGWLSPIALGISIVWGAIQIYTWVRNEIRAYRAKKGS